MRGLAACFGDDANDVFFTDACCHGRREFLADEYCSCGSVADLYFLHAKQDRKHAVFDITHVSGTLHGQVVSCCGEHIDKHLADLFDSCFCALLRLYQLFDLTAHERITDDRNMTLKDLCFFVACRFTDAFRLLHGVFTEPIDRFSVAFQFRIYIRYGCRSIFQRLFHDQHDSSDADAVGCADTF